MKTLYIAPYFGQHKYAYLRRMFESMQVAYPGDDALAAQTTTVLPMPGGDIFLHNNNIDNVGFTRAINAGFRFGLERGYDLLWSGNDDLEFPDFRATMSAVEAEFAEHPKTGIAGCQLVYTEEPDFIYHGGTTRAFPAGLHKWGRRSNNDLQVRTRERWVAGGCMVVSRSCAMEIGMLDEHFFNIGSDSDYGYRARLAGFDVVYLPTPVMHPRGSMTQKTNPENEERMRQDMEYFYHKWAGTAVFKEFDEGAI
jgi:GT2 family glycosyltransferase